MFISIIIPTRNRFEYVNQLINDILQQDVTNYEVIVVDQSDHPITILNCNHIITETKGPCISRNIGVKQAKGEILVFLDDDARVNSNFINEITSFIINGKYQVVSGAICDVNGNIPKGKKNFWKSEKLNFIKAITSNPTTETSRISLAFSGGCSAMLKTVFNEVGGFDESFDPTGAGEDRDMALKLFKNGNAIWYNANAKLLHIGAKDGGSRDMGSRTFMIDIHTHIMCEKYFSPELAAALKRTLIDKYKKNFYKSILNFKEIRTKFLLLQKIKNI